MPRETVYIRLGSLPVYEAGAAFLACIAYPDSESDQGKLWRALCRQTIVEMAIKHSDWAVEMQGIRPEHFTMRDDTAEKIVKAGFAQINDRILASTHYLMPFLKGASHVSGLKTTVNNMAILALADIKSDSVAKGNMINRVFVPSRPVIHAAAALGMMTQEYHKTHADEGAYAGLILHHVTHLRTAVERSEQLRIALRELDNPKIPEEETIQFLLR